MTLLDNNDAARSFPGFAPNGDAQSGRTLRQRTARPLSEERLTHMSTDTGKRGFVASQPAAAISALDFAARLSAYHSARAKLEATDVEDEAGIKAACDAMIRAQEALIATPVRPPALIAEKVNALYHRFGGEREDNLSDPTTQAEIIGMADLWKGSEEDVGQCLLSVYLDLTAAQQNRAAWDAVVQAVEAAWAEVEAVNARERETDEDCSEEWGVVWDRHGEALEALLNTRAPDAVAMGLKARLIIEKAMSDHRDDDPDNPDTLSRLMGDGDWSEHAMAALYQDGLAFAGVISPAALAAPEKFDGVAWLHEAEAAFGVRFATTPQQVNRLTPKGRDVAGARAAFKALPTWKRSEAWSSVLSRESAEKQEADRAAAEARGPMPAADLRPIFVNGLLNTFEGAERDDVRAKLAAMGLEAA